MLGKFIGFVEEKPASIIIAVLLVTALFFIPLSSLEIHNDTKLFMPKSVLEPLERYEKLVGIRAYHWIYVIGKGHESMLSVEVLKEQLELTDFLHSNFDVETVSAAEIIEKELNKDNKSIRGMESDEELGKAVYGLFEKSPKDFIRLAQLTLDGRVDTGSLKDMYILQKFWSFVPFSGLNLDGIELPYARVATIHVMAKEGNLSEDEQKRTSVLIREGVDNLDFEHIRALHESSGLISYDVDQKLAGNTAFLTVMVLVSMSLLLFSGFRRLYFVFIPFLITAVTIVWTFGTAVLLGLEFTALHTIIIALLIGIALDGPIHLAKRFAEIRGKKGFSDSLKETVSSMLPALFLASLTTVGGFAVGLILPSPPALLSFALTIVIGVTYAFLLVCLLWPAFISLRKTKPALESGQVVRRTMNWVYDVSITHSNIIMAILMVSLLASVYTAGRIETNTKNEMFLPDGSPTKEAIKVSILNSISYGENYVLIEGDVLQPEILPALDRLEENVQDNEFFERTGNTVRFESINTLLRNFNVSDMENLEKTYDGLYASNAAADPVTGMTFGEKARTILYKEEGEYGYITAKFRIKSEYATEVEQSYNDLMEDIGQSGLRDIPGITIDATGRAFSHGQTVLLTREVQLIGSLLMFVLTFLILLLIYREVTLSIIVSLPILIGSILSLGLMVLLEIPLTTLSAVVVPVVIGLGIDYSIYLAQRYREELKKHDRKEAARIALEHTGEGNWLAAATTILGFLIVSLSIMPMAESFGILTATAIMVTFLVTIFLLPILLVRFVKS